MKRTDQVKAKKHKPALGVDFGNVIIELVSKTGTSFYTNKFLECKPISGAFIALRKLLEECFGNNIFIISKCTQVEQKKIKAWLLSKDFYKKTGLPQKNLIFSLSDLIKQKLPID